MITQQGKTNLLYGEFVEQNLKLIGDLVYQLQDHKIDIQDIDGDVIMRITSDTNGVYIQTNDGLGGLTAPIQVQDIIGTNTLPSTPGDSYVEITAILFKVIMDNELRFKIEANELYTKVDSICIENATQPLKIQANMNLGQEIQIINKDDSSIQLKITKNWVNAMLKPILGVVASLDLTSAVNLQQLNTHTHIASNITDFNIAVQTNKLNELTAPNGSVSMNAQLLTNLLDPISLQDGASKNYVDNAVSGAIGLHTHVVADITDFNNGVQTNTLNSLAVPVGNVDMNNNKIINLSNPINIQDATTKNYVDNQISVHNHLHTQITDFDFGVRQNRIEQLALPVSQVDVNSQKITSLATPTADFDGANKKYVDNAITAQINSHTHDYTDIVDFQLGVQQARLDDLQPPLTDLNMNTTKIQNLVNPVGTQDASTKAYVDTQINTHTHTTAQITNFVTQVVGTKLSAFQPPDVSVNMNLQQLTNLGIPVLSSDATTKSYVDSLLLSHTHLAADITDFDAKVSSIKLNSLNLPDGDLDMNSNKIVGLAMPTNSQDATNKQYVDDQIANHTHLAADITDFDTQVQITRVNELSLPNASLDMNNQQIKGVASPTDPNDVATKQYIDTQLGNHTHVVADITDFDAKLATIKLSNFALPDSDLNLNNYNITNLADPINNQDAATKAYVDSQLGSQTYLASDITDFDNQVQTTKLNELSLPNGDLDMNNYKIINLADPIGNQDAVNKQYLDYQINNHTHLAADITDFDTQVQTTKLNELSLPSGDIDMNAYTFKNVGTPVNDNDVATKAYIDSVTQVGGHNHSYLDITDFATGVASISLDSLTAPSNSLNMNFQQIKNVDTPTDNNDAVNKIYADLLMPVGGIVMWSVGIVPANYLVCNGQLFSGVTYPLLQAVLGSLQVPDLRGQFIRCFDPTGIIDPDGLTRTLGDTQLDSIKSHTHTGTTNSGGGGLVPISGTTGSSTVGIRSNDNAGSSSQQVMEFDELSGSSVVQHNASSHTHTFSGNVTIPSHSHTFTTNSTGVTETRPKNVCLVFLIRAK